MLEREGLEARGKDAVIVGQSNIVGRPMALELLMKAATVTSATARRRTSRAMSARRRSWSPRSASRSSCRAAGSGRARSCSTSASTACRTASWSATSSTRKPPKRAGWITPVPGGVGPMTIAALMKNTLESCQRRK